MSAQATQESPTKNQGTTCINQGCNKAIDAGVKFCPFCRTLQSEKQTTTSAGETSRVNVPPPKREPSPTHDRGIVMRASSSIWDFTEREEDVASGQRRPLLVLDEQTIHLSHTDKKLDSYDLLERVQAIIQAYEVPIKVEREIARWQSDPGEGRPRIITWLEGHSHKDYKMIFGVDYMGRWASIKMYLAVEPPVIPELKEKKTIPVFRPIYAISLFVFSILLIFIGKNSEIIGCAVVGWFLILAIFPCFSTEVKEHQKKMKEYRIYLKEEKEVRKMVLDEQAKMKDLFRTYKIDDMRLFSSAMNVVFQAVVDDIVQKDGAKIERIEGGKGGYITEEGMTSIPATPRVSNAKDLGL